MKDRVSVIIVNWNGKKWLKKCLDSLENQTYKNREIIIVDNASNDGSAEYLSKEYPKIRLIKNKKNLGFSTANNMGVKLSTGKYLLLINNDAWVEEDFIEKLLIFYKKHDYSVISPLEKRYKKEEITVLNTTIDPIVGPAYFIPKLNKKKLFYMSVCYLCTRKEYDESKGFDQNYFMYYEDVDWFWRLNLLGKKYTYVKDTFIYHAGGGSAGKGIKYNTSLWRNQNVLQTMIKNYSLVSLIIFLPIYLLQSMIEIIFFLLQLKFSISFSYIQGIYFNLMNLERTLKERRWVQRHRLVNDFTILKRMYIGSSRFMHFKRIYG